MKDQYVGDVNDFLKYALLRGLAGRSLSLAVIWMLTPSDGRGDGSKLGYLSRPSEYRVIDDAAFDALALLVSQGDRTIAAVERSGVLDAQFASDLIPDEEAGREDYLRGALRMAKEADVVFFDPDNGLAVGSVLRGRRNSGKYLYWDELATAYRSGHSVVVYQHFPRVARSVYLEDIAERVKTATGSEGVLALTTSHVAFIIVPQLDVSDLLASRLTDFVHRAAPYASARLL